MSQGGNGNSMPYSSVILLLSVPTPTAPSPPSQECPQPPRECSVAGQNPSEGCRTPQKHMESSSCVGKEPQHTFSACMCVCMCVFCTVGQYKLKVSAGEGARMVCFFYFFMLTNAPSVAVC